MRKHYIPLIVSVALALVLWAGISIGSHSNQTRGYVPNDMEQELGDMDQSGIGKLNYLFGLLNYKYVDTLNISKLVEDAIPTIIEELDPHSSYIPAKELQSVNEQLDGSFSGVGIQFNIQQDTVMVIQVISGGPSERVGLMPGDRLVTVDDSLFVGKEVTNERVQKKLRGVKGSHVKLGIARATSDELLEFDIERGDIPVNSVVAQYVIDEVGYIKIDNFGRNTYAEFFTALINLKARGAKSYLLDFRGNGGGYMEVCCQMVNEFLDEGSLIVYTEGKSRSREDICADGRGNFKSEPVVVLIDEFSASASEIFSGAMQDNDRGTIVGRRSFGKGLVQQQIAMNDGSAIRLTIARYHTPSGRCIQKPYDMGKGDDYAMDIVNRYERGEFYSQDSIHVADSLKFLTRQGRTVYGGGGIMPDVFVPSDTTTVTRYYNRSITQMYAFAFQYTDAHREQLQQYKTFDEMESYLRTLGLLNKFVEFAAPKLGRPTSTELKRSGKEMERLIIAYIMRQSKDENYFYQEYNSSDVTYLKGLELLK